MVPRHIICKAVSPYFIILLQCVPLQGFLELHSAGCLQTHRDQTLKAGTREPHPGLEPIRWFPDHLRIYF